MNIESLVARLDVSNCGFQQLVEALRVCKTYYFEKDECICDLVTTLLLAHRHPIIDAELGIIAPTGTREEKRELRKKLFVYRTRGNGGCKLLAEDDFPEAYVRTSKGYYFSLTSGSLQLRVGERYVPDRLDALLFARHPLSVVRPDV